VYSVYKNYTKYPLVPYTLNKNMLVLWSALLTWGCTHNLPPFPKFNPKSLFFALGHLHPLHPFPGYAYKKMEPKNNTAYALYIARLNLGAVKGFC